METKPKVKKDNKYYGYKLCALPEKSIDLLRALGKRDSVTYGEVVNEACRLYIEKYPDARNLVHQDLADNLLKRLAKEGK